MIARPVAMPARPPVARGRVLAAILSVACAIGAAAAGAMPAGTAPDPNVYATAQRLVRLPDGRRMNLYCTGAGSPTVILEGGWSTTTLSWRKVQPSVARLTRVCSYDRAAYGFSDPGPLPRTAGAVADDLHALLDAARVPGPYLLVAHSLGGLDARMFAARHLGDMAGLLLLDPTVPEQQADIAAFADAVAACHRDLSANKIAPDAPEVRICLDPPSPQLPAAVSAARRAAQLRPAYQAASLSELRSLPASAAELERARGSWGAMPLLVLTAGESNADPSLTPEARAALDRQSWSSHEAVARQSSRGVHRLVPGASHFLPQEHPDLVVGATAELVARARATRH